MMMGNQEDLDDTGHMNTHMQADTHTHRDRETDRPQRGERWLRGCVIKPQRTNRIVHFHKLVQQGLEIAINLSI